MAESAGQVNEGISRRRQAAAKSSANVIDLESMRKRNEEMDVWVLEQVDECASLELEVKGLNEQKVAIYDAIEAKGLDRKAFKDAVKLRKMDADKRSKYLMTMRRLARQFGFEDGQQLDLLDPILKPSDQPDLPGVNAAPTMSEEERQKAIAEHIDKHGTKPIEH